jgi:predicted Ser/Thr protein kinase
MGSRPGPRPPSRAELSARAHALLNRGNRRNPDVFLVEHEGASVVVKDFAPRGALVRAWLGPWLLRRELRAYRVLEGHPAVPRLLGPVDRLAFAVEFRPGRRMSRRLAGDVPPAFVDALEAAVREMHARGVVHLDLRHRSNVLVGDDGAPILIDFASAFCFRPGGLAARWLLPPLAVLDLRAVEKWRRRLVPHASAAGGGASSHEGTRGASRPT